MKTRAAYDDIDFSPPEGAQLEAARGLEWHAQGHSGDGLTPATVRWARKIAAGDDITPDKARKMRAWLARHEVDKKGEGFKPGENGYPSPGRVAWALWSGDAGVSWSNKLVAQMDAADEAKSTRPEEGINVDKSGMIIRRDGQVNRAAPYDEDEDKEEGKTKKGTTTVIASAPTPDRYNDIVDPSWNLDRFMANPVVQWAHDYSIPPVGRVESLKVVNGSLIAEIEWDESEENKLGQTVASQFRRGFLSAVSVGFAPGSVTPRSELEEGNPYRGDSGNLYRNPELLELSAVPIPAHPGALAIRSVEPDKQRHIIAFEENDDTYVVTYAKAERQAEEVEQAAAPDVMREVFGDHPLDSLFGPCPSKLAKEPTS